MKERDLLHKNALRSKLSSDWAKYKKVRNKIINKQKMEEYLGQKRKLHQCGKDSGKIWKSVKNILHWLSNGSPNKLFYEGKLISKSQELATAQNKFFLDKIRKIKENLPNPTINPLAKLSTFR